jgi:D-alanyl-D-alanine carboxypeptidase
MVRRALLAVTCLCLVVAACDGDEGDVRAADDTTTSSARRATTATTTTSSTTSTTAAARPIAATTTTRRPSPPVTAEPQVLPFAATIEVVTAEDLYASWRPGCPVPLEQLRAIDVRHFGNDGAVHTGRLIIAANLANGMVDIFRDLYNARFPIQRMEPIDVYGGDDMRSIKANNTSAFNCRAVTGGSGWSEHAYGRAIDVNPFVNPYVKGSTVLPPEAAPYTDRSRNDPGMIHADDAVVRAFAARGWAWGGYWSSLKDYQHFSTTGR